MVEALKVQGVKEFAATGYCFGGTYFISTDDEQCRIPIDDSPWLGRYTFDLAFDNIIKVAAVSHPSLLSVPKDLEVRAVIFKKIFLRFFFFIFIIPQKTLL